MVFHFASPRRITGRVKTQIALCAVMSTVSSSAYSSPKPSGVGPGGEKVTLAVTNARIWTADEGKASTPHDKDALMAILIAGDHITAIVASEQVGEIVDSSTRILDIQGRRVIPGITDSHTHIVGGGLQMSRLALREVRGKEAFVRAVGDAASSIKPGEWVLGGRWSVESWPTVEAPSRAWIDPVTGEVPVFLTRMDGHQALANTAALAVASITAAGPADPTGGEIERNPATREPTGILKESAMELVRRHIPPTTPEQRYEALRRAMAHANSLGVTSVHDMSEPADLDTFRMADADGALTVRITAYLSVSDWASFVDQVANYTYKSPMFRLAGFKGYMDGSLGSRTAYMREPYRDATPDMPYPRGQLTAMAASKEAFREQVRMADEKGLQVAVHAIGDEANHLLLDAYDAASREGGRRDAWHRIEHAQHLLPEDIPRFARLGVVASMQPFHKADDGRYAEKALGEARMAGSYAFRQLVDAGALLCFGSDWPVVTLNPFEGIASAVNATTLTGAVWLPSHSVTLAEALEAYTRSPARAVHRGDSLGTIAPGKLADLVVLDKDPFALPPTRLSEVRVAMTMVSGRVVYNAMK